MPPGAAEEDGKFPSHRFARWYFFNEKCWKFTFFRDLSGLTGQLGCGIERLREASNSDVANGFIRKVLDLHLHHDGDT